MIPGPRPLPRRAILRSGEIQRASKRFREMTKHVRGSNCYAEAERVAAAGGLVDRLMEEGKLTHEQGEDVKLILGSIYWEKLSELKRAYSESGLQAAMEAQGKALKSG